jgi:hypothetical protein
LEHEPPSDLEHEPPSDLAPDATEIVSDTAADAPAEELAESVPPVVAQPAADSADAALVEGVSGGLTWIPFACYLGLWLVLSGLSAYLLHGASAEQPARWMPEYMPLVWGGVGLVALGPLLSLLVWLVARARRPKIARRGLLSSSMTRGALVAFFGVAIWLGTLFVLETLASGGTL